MAKWHVVDMDRYVSGPHDSAAIAKADAEMSAMDPRVRPKWERARDGEWRYVPHEDPSRLRKPGFYVVDTDRLFDWPAALEQYIERHNEKNGY